MHHCLAHKRRRLLSLFNRVYSASCSGGKPTLYDKRAFFTTHAFEKKEEKETNPQLMFYYEPLQVFPLENLPQLVDRNPLNRSEAATAFSPLLILYSSEFTCFASFRLASLAWLFGPCSNFLPTDHGNLLNTKQFIVSASRAGPLPLLFETLEGDDSVQCKRASSLKQFERIMILLFVAGHLRFWVQKRVASGHGASCHRKL